ncbi:MAG: hypothetical protein FJ109_00060 [Deltaproteobacteria bacterium]|nr:hypothetical protein [Deltaproteobacteria bacterium]
MCTIRRAACLAVALLAAACLTSCSQSSGGSGPPADIEIDSSRSPDSGLPPADVTKTDGAPADLQRGESNPDAPVQDEGVPLFGPFPATPAGSPLPPGIVSCPVYRQTRCDDGLLSTCDLYDAAAGDWAASPDAYAEQIFWYDRYFDLYHRMEGQQSEFLYTEPMPPGTPESLWGAAEKVQTYTGHWDSAGWTGTALQAAAARYAMTGTEADYERMLSQLEAMMFMYEATGVPGLLMRCHYAMLPEGAPNPVGHPGKALIPYSPPEVWADRNPIPEGCLARLPAYYADGVDIQGTHYSTTPFWMGDASRDMYVRSLPGILLAYDFLGQGEREDKMRGDIRTYLPCTLKRLKKLRIVNLQKNSVIMEAIAAYFGKNSLHLDPGDLDLATLDTVIGYVMEEPRPDKPGTFDPACPDSLPMEVHPDYDFDASSEDFMIRFLTTMARLGQGEEPIAWILFPSVRGGDALYMLQWAQTGYYLLGDERFLDYARQLMEETEFWPVVDTMGSFWLPKWCKPHYGPSLAYPTFWNLQNRVDRTQFPVFWNKLATAVREEYRFKELVDANDCYFGVLYDSMVDDAIDPDAHAYASEMVAMLRETGQYQVDDPFEPRRSYNTDLIENPPAGFSVKTVPLSPEDKKLCTEPVEVFGMKFEMQKMEDELPRAVKGLPIRYRIGGPFQWQEDPFQLHKDYGDRNGRTQWPMSGLSAAYWTGRLQGTITDGAGLVLAWREDGETCRELQDTPGAFHQAADGTWEGGHAARARGSQEAGRRFLAGHR